MALATTWSLIIAKDGFSNLNVKEITQGQSLLCCPDCICVYKYMYVLFSGKKLYLKSGSEPRTLA